MPLAEAAGRPLFSCWGVAGGVLRRGRGVRVRAGVAVVGQVCSATVWRSALWVGGAAAWGESVVVVRREGLMRGVGAGVHGDV